MKYFNKVQTKFWGSTCPNCKSNQASKFTSLSSARSSNTIRRSRIILGQSIQTTITQLRNYLWSVEEWILLLNLSNKQILVMVKVIWKNTILVRWRCLVFNKIKTRNLWLWCQSKKKLKIILIVYRNFIQWQFYKMTSV